VCMSSAILRVFTNAKHVARYSNTVYSVSSLTLLLISSSFIYPTKCTTRLCYL